jgi:hypothetical protein
MVGHFSVQLIAVIGANMGISTNAVHNPDFAEFAGSNEVKVLKPFFTITAGLKT